MAEKGIILYKLTAIVKVLPQVLINRELLITGNMSQTFMNIL